MTDYQREVAWLLHGSGHPPSEIARRLGVSEEEVKDAICRRWRDMGDEI